MAVIPVSAAVIRRGGEILVCSRPRHSALADFWEFPGGKQEPGETPEACLVREIQEELSVAIRVGRALHVLEHTYPDKAVRVTFFDAVLLNPAAPLVPRDDQEIRWVRPTDLPTVNFLPADRPLAEKLSRLTQ